MVSSVSSAFRVTTLLERVPRIELIRVSRGGGNAGARQHQRQQAAACRRKPVPHRLRGIVLDFMPILLHVLPCTRICSAPPSSAYCTRVLFVGHRIPQYAPISGCFWRIRSVFPRKRSSTGVQKAPRAGGGVSFCQREQDIQHKQFPLGAGRVMAAARISRSGSACCGYRNRGSPCPPLVVTGRSSLKGYRMVTVVFHMDGQAAAPAVDMQADDPLFRVLQLADRSRWPLSKALPNRAYTSASSMKFRRLPSAMQLRRMLYSPQYRLFSASTISSASFAGC